MSLLVSIVMCSARVNCGFGYTAECTMYADTNLGQSCQALAIKHQAECRFFNPIGQGQVYWSRCSVGLQAEEK